MTSPAPPRSYTGAIAFLAVAGFASQAMVRSLDSLLPQIAGDFGTTVGVASIVVSAYSLMHGTMQLDEFVASYEWAGQSLRFHDTDKNARYEVKLGERRR